MTSFFPRPDGLPPPNGYSHAVSFTGRLVVISGQVPLSASGEIPADPAGQVRQVFENLATALAGAGADFRHVVKLTVFLTDLADLPTFREIRDQYLPADQPPPASSLVQVAGLVNPSFRVEIEALAAV
ncbi:RidA family protein [Actinophytocola sp.]|uniref:RidA family protein n=1 Tax=Actinophytocola sp. TaxID=1872138 RepID=UPI002ED89DF4